MGTVTIANPELNSRLPEFVVPGQEYTLKFRRPSSFSPYKTGDTFGPTIDRSVDWSTGKIAVSDAQSESAATDQLSTCGTELQLHCAVAAAISAIERRYDQKGRNLYIAMLFIFVDRVFQGSSE